MADDPLTLLAKAVVEAARRDREPCPACGGDRLRPDFRAPGPPCHAQIKREDQR